jgi:hypothetical protein
MQTQTYAVFRENRPKTGIKRPYNNDNNRVEGKPGARLFGICHIVKRGRDEEQYY